jgi:hypothetical protein
MLISLIDFGTGVWPSGYSGGLAHRRPGFESSAGTASIHLNVITPSAVSIFGMNMCAIKLYNKTNHLII